jgi:hypothetical protein
LSGALFIYDGTKGKFGLEIPSVSNPLNDKKWMQKQTIPTKSIKPDLKKKKKRRRVQKVSKREQQKKR